VTDLNPALKELLAAYHRARGPRRLEAVADVVHAFTPAFAGLRPIQPGYLSRRDVRRAYVEYYLPLNVAKVARVLDELATFADLRRPLRVLDFGAGPGTASVAFRLWGGQIDRLVLVDVVEEALDEAEILLGPTFERAAEPPPGPYDLVFACNVLVEMQDPRRFEPVLEELDPRGYAVVIEPALREPTQRLMEWRDRLVERGWKIAAPCLGIARCPMRATNLWCHQDLGWSPPGWIAEIDDRLGRTREGLKYSYLVITKAGTTLADRADWRVVSNRHREKGKSWAWLCGHEGALWRAEALTRDRARLREFFRAERGDLLRIGGPTGGRLGPTSSVARPSPSGIPRSTP
jgi:SAM-dependent methyltransferase